MKVANVNESTCIVTLGDTISEPTADRVTRLVAAIREHLSDVVTDLVPSYTTVLISYDLQRINGLSIRQRITELLAQIDQDQGNTKAPRLIEIPVYYGAEVGLDLDEVASITGLSIEEIIRLHTGTDYRVYAIGFTPGYAYLGVTDERLRVPRKSTPRLKVPKGSMAIADNQTAVYPSTSPGGWQVLGRTPTQMLDWQSETLALMEVGDRVRFNPIDRDTYLQLGGTFDEF
ncbi:5-oxoprolinase subunit PxpB [Pokkaliibacter sp. CJK22405]|uniref:5-oxoprolinase subunit PxpB n=1 Tax=Pokkaliibacter sp. CJK22405 TaxID=3384615 RepID=UPI0039854A00